jgi:hypothetical protein
MRESFGFNRKTTVRMRLKETTIWYSAVRCIVTYALSMLAVPLVTTAQPRGDIPLIGVLEPNPSTTNCFMRFQ